MNAAFYAAFAILKIKVLACHGKSRNVEFKLDFELDFELDFKLDCELKKKY